MLLQVAYNEDLNFLFISLLLVFLIVFWRIKYRGKTESIYFKVGSLISTSGVLLVLIALLQVWTLGNGIISALILYPIGLTIILLINLYTLRIIRRFQENLKEIIDKSSSVSVNVANMATELAASASEVNAASEEISSTTQEVANDSQNMVISSNEIKRVMDIIVSISEQTNLLALNASIEAGRAGEHGRGFAVVADEVRKLAEASKNSVRTTGDKIREILKGIESTSSSLEAISASVEQQTASMEEVSATANRLGTLAEELKNELAKSEETGKNRIHNNKTKPRKESERRFVKIASTYRNPKHMKRIN